MTIQTKPTGQYFPQVLIIVLLLSNYGYRHIIFTLLGNRWQILYIQVGKTDNLHSLIRTRKTYWNCFLDVCNVLQVNVSTREHQMTILNHLALERNSVAVPPHICL